MVLRNHIAYRFLTDSNFWIEMTESTFPELFKQEVDEIPESVKSFLYCVDNKKNNTYVVTNSVVENLDMLKVNKTGEHFNWNVFDKLTNQKNTFVFYDGSLLRMVVSDNTLWFCRMKFDRNPDSKYEGHAKWVMFYVDKDKKELCSHFKHKDVLEIEEFVYKFLCFFFLTDNNEEIIKPGASHGTRKAGKIINHFNFPITIVNSKWNTTVIRTEAFGVRGHFRIQPCGKGRMDYELIFIAPYQKNGYIRRAKNLDLKNE